MNTVQDIEKQIEGEYAKFQQSFFLGTVPKDLIENFKKAILDMAPNRHQLHTKTIKTIIGKKTNELTYVELGMVVNTILAAPLFTLSEDLTSALIKLEKIETVRNDYNLAVQRKEAELMQKKQTMLKLANPGSSSNGKLSLAN